VQRSPAWDGGDDGSGSPATPQRSVVCTDPHGIRRRFRRAADLCPSAWAVILLYSGLAAFSGILAVAFAPATGDAVFMGFLAVAGALSACGAFGTYRRLTGRHRLSGT